MVRSGSARKLSHNRPRSLRRAWTRAFVLMLALVMATGTCTIVGMWQLVAKFNGVAVQRDRETSVVGSLRASIIAHETAGHAIYFGGPIDRAAFIRQQSADEALFQRAIDIFPAGN